MPNPSQKSLHALDALNLFLADVRDGVGHYLSVYLKSSQQWHPAEIGVAISASAIAIVATVTFWLTVPETKSPSVQRAPAAL